MSGGGQIKAWQAWMWILVPLVLFVGLPVGWGLWDEGVFDEDLSYDVTATALDADDTQRVLDLYTEASAAHGICYGWRVDAGTGAPIEQGSNLGLGTSPTSETTGRCPRWMVMSVTYSYIFKEWGSVNVSVTDNVQEIDVDPNLLVTHGIVDTMEPEGISQLADVLGALPMLAAAEGAQGVAPLPAKEQAPDPTASTNDELSPVHGFGWYLLLGVSGLLVLLGLFWIISGAVRARKAGHP